MKLDSVEICEDLTRDEIIQKFEEIKKESDSFEEEYKHDHQATFGVYINCIGYFIITTDHEEANQEVDIRIWPSFFSIDKEGAPIAYTQHSLYLAQNSKTRVALF